MGGRMGKLPFMNADGAPPVLGKEKTTQNGWLGLMGDVSLGTPPQTLTVEFRTSGTEFWVVGADCNDDQCKQSPFYNYTRKRFDTKASTTYAAASPAKPFTNGYGNGSTGSDVFSINGGDTWKNVSGMTLEVITQSSSGALQWNPTDGVFGLGMTRPAGSDPDALSSQPLDQLLKVVDQKVYTIWMSPLSDGSMNGNAQLTIGGADSDNCNASWTYADIPKGNQMWSVAGVTAKFGDDLNTTTGIAAYFDPANAYIVGPDDLIMGIAKMANSKIVPYGDLVVDCSVSLPSLDLTINGNTYSIPSSQYIMKLPGGTCKLALMPQEEVWGWSIGAPFYRSYCVMHDVGGARLGMAAQQGNSAGYLRMGALNMAMIGMMAFFAYFVNILKM
jgi:hypothetical protein